MRIISLKLLDELFQVTKQYFFDMDDSQLAAAITVLYVVILNLMFTSYYMLMTSVLQKDSRDYNL
jgi:hypothetical protein